tara:strand:- start:362 stop:655 length:294 start_codon:yes stop_codon:yes gene_type:complete
MSLDAINSTDLKEKVIKYFNKKSAWTYGFLRYSVIKKSLIHVTKLQKSYLIRKIFIMLVEEGFFIKKKNELVRSYLYKFRNPSLPVSQKKETTISWD